MMTAAEGESPVIMASYAAFPVKIVMDQWRRRQDCELPAFQE